MTLKFIWLAAIVNVYATVDSNGINEVETIPMEFTTKEACYEWKAIGDAEEMPILDPATKRKLVIQARTCTPMRSSDVLRDIESIE